MAWSLFALHIDHVELPWIFWKNILPTPW
jgi:hypothetical protein